MRSKQINEMAKWLFAYSCPIQKDPYYYRTPMRHGMMGGYGLSSTPLVEGLIAMQAIIPQFQTDNKLHVASFQRNVNEINKILQLNKLPEDGVWDENTGNAMTYLTQNIDLFRQYGITEHMKARELDKMISPAEKVFTDAEYPPTMNEMKALEIDIEKLYEERA